MTAIAGADQRDVNPRWRPFGTAVGLGELSSVGHRTILAPTAPSPEALEAFEGDPGLYTAGALLSEAIGGHAISHDVSKAIDLIQTSPVATEAARRLAGSLAGGRPIESTPVDPYFDEQLGRRRVSRMRQIVKTEPLNAIRWVDLALAHVNLGAVQKAGRELQVAVRLAPHNRHVLRSATRFYVLLNDLDRALWLLRENPATAVDPWLQSAELALTEQLSASSRRIRQARAMVNDQNLSPLDLSELASELATTELRAGKLKLAKKYMRMAVVDPTENALAQSEWARRHGVDVGRDRAEYVPRSFEADALEYLGQGNFVGALRSGQLWQADQPFAADAAAFTSYAATVGQQDWAAGIFAARQGLIANPSDAMLRNNLVFSLVNDGQLDLAAEEFNRIAPSGDAAIKATLSATSGLIAFRSGDLSEGRRLYNASAEQFRRLGQKDREKLACLLLAREEVLCGSEEAPIATRRALEMARGSTDQTVQVWTKRLERLVLGTAS